MAEITFDAAAFRALFSAFADTVGFPDATLQSYFDTATCYMSDQVGNRTVDCLTERCRQLALNQLTAHLCQLAQDTLAGKTTGVVTSASVGSVSVGTIPSPFGNSTFAYWLSATSYGLALLALLRSCVAGGFYIGGRCERGAFRKVGGSF